MPEDLAPHEMSFAELVWAHAPIGSGELVKLADQQLGWKKSTTYTVLRKLCEKGLFRNENSSVSVLVTKDEYVAGRSRQFVEDNFGGSLPLFVATFMGRRNLDDDQIAELRRLIDEYEE